ncbi:MAG TPA: hypothetical protein VL326_27360 [Kofleriaceae bacterium]|nr:hypothetical protein [Kofleriaceae bacterium]
MGLWDDQRANDLEPAHQRLEPDEAGPKQGARDEIARRNDRSVDAILRSAPTMKADTQQTSGPVQDPDVKALLEKHPTKTRGPDGYAAWLLEAIRLELVAAPSDKDNPMPVAQLHDLVDPKKPVRTWEYKQDDKVDEKAEEDRKKATKGQLDNAHRVPADKDHPSKIKSPTADRGYKPYEWDIDIKEAPILEPLVAVARARITAWMKNGGQKKKVLSIGDFVRADMWHGSPDSVPIHNPGTAMDLFFAGRGTRDGETMELLDDLPARAKLVVFLDNPGALHLDVRGSDTYGLGIPSGPEFIPLDIVIEHDDHGAPTRAAEQAAGGNQSGTLSATGVKRFSGVVSKGTATWGVVDKKTNKMGWVWTWTPTNESMLKYMNNTKLLNAINAYNSKKS